MEDMFANRMKNLPRSFIREILKVTVNPEVISFAGGLPNPRLFPVEEIKEAAVKVLSNGGNSALQYSTSEGYLPLREYIAKRYEKSQGIIVEQDDILIINGSQQGMDLIGKVFLDQGDSVLLEKPAYLGAIQAFSIFEPIFSGVPLMDDGPDVDLMKEILEKNEPKLMYMVPNFQNPSGITHSLAKREALAERLSFANTLVVEDDPYGEIRFRGENLPSYKTFLKNRTILLGSFSKIVAPGMRLGWICAGPEVMEKLIIAKQASDLHSNYFAQRVVHQYLLDNDLDEHIAQIQKAYGQQRDCMVAMMRKHFPPEIKYTEPEGGMFIWVTLRPGMSSLQLFEQAAHQNVVFVPGTPFYTDGGGQDTLRINYSNCDEEMIEEGIKRLGTVMRGMLG